MSTPDPEILDELRPAAFAVAYRMLGSVAEAEDVVQEALLRVHAALAAPQAIASPRAYLTTVTTRLAIDQLRSARARREVYTGDWLPEPVVTDTPDDPARAAEMSESLSIAFLVLLERLSPEQRAALLLHDVFGYGYDEVAEIVGTTQANARQLATRARRHVAEGRPRFDASKARREALARRFFAAAQDGDLAALEALLADDIVLRGDGGGKVPALARPVHGRERVARTLAAWTRQGSRHAGARFRLAEVNGQPGAMLVAGDGSLISVMALEIAGKRVHGVSSIINPDKLGHLGPVADLQALLRQAGTSRPS